jgi:hypothetical protein
MTALERIELHLIGIKRREKYARELSTHWQTVSDTTRDEYYKAEDLYRSVKKDMQVPATPPPECKGGEDCTGIAL